MNALHIYPIRFSQLSLKISNNQNLFFFKIQENKSSLNREGIIITDQLPIFILSLQDAK